MFAKLCCFIILGGVRYPAYLNSRMSVKQGRRISKAKAIDNPTCPEIRDVCLSQK